MSALKRFSFFAGFLLFFASSALESTPRAIGNAASRLILNEHASIQIEAQISVSCQEQACCLPESVEEIKERSEDHFRSRLFTNALFITQPFYPPFLTNTAVKTVEKTGNHTRRFLIFCNWRL